MAYAKVQSTQQTGGGALTTAKAYASNVTAGNVLIAAISSNGSDPGQYPASSVTDSQGNTWTQVGTAEINPTSLDAIQIFWAIAGSSAANTVTAHFPGVAQGDTLTIHEYSGNATSPFDKQGVNTGSSNAPALASSITPANANSLIFSAEVDANGDGITITAGTNYTIDQTQLNSSANERIGTERWIQTTATATTGAFSLGSSAQWAIKTAIFSPAAAVVVKHTLGSLGVGG